MPSFKSNRKEQKKVVENGGWKAAYGRELTETDALEGAVAAGVSITTGNPAAVTAWLNTLISESISKLSQSIIATITQEARRQAQEFALEVIKQLINGMFEGEQFRQFGTLAFKAGLVQFLGRNYVWVPGTNIGDLISTGDAGGHWEPFGPHTVAYAPYVAFRVGPANSSTPGTDPNQPILIDLQNLPGEVGGEEPDPGESDTSPIVNSVYEIITSTGPRFFGGTDARVFVQLSGTNGMSLIIQLNTTINQMERGDVNSYLIATRNVGNLTSLWIGHDNTGFNPSWFLEEVRIRDVSTGQVWFLPCNRWLARLRDDGQIQRTLEPTGSVV